MKFKLIIYFSSNSVIFRWVTASICMYTRPLSIIHAFLILHKLLYYLFWTILGPIQLFWFIPYKTLKPVYKTRKLKQQYILFSYHVTMKLLQEGKKNERKYSAHLLNCSMQVLESSICQRIAISPYKMSKNLGCSFQTTVKGDSHRAGD